MHAKPSLLTAILAGSSEPLYVIEGLFNCTTPILPNVPPKPCPAGGKGEYQIVPLMLHLVTDISAVRLYLPKNLVPLGWFGVEGTLSKKLNL